MTVVNSSPNRRFSCRVEGGGGSLLTDWVGIRITPPPYSSPPAPKTKSLLARQRFQRVDAKPDPYPPLSDAPHRRNGAWASRPVPRRSGSSPGFRGARGPDAGSVVREEGEGRLGGPLKGSFSRLAFIFLTICL